MEKLLLVISRILKKSPEGRSRIDVSKLVYYCDGVSFQRHIQTITRQRYIHLETHPEALNFSRAILELNKGGYLEVKLQMSDSMIHGFYMHFLKDYPGELTREEERLMNKVLIAFKSKVTDESRHYPNLYETYVISPLYSEIPFSAETVNTKVHFLKKKSLLTLSGKIFRVFFT